MGSGFQYNKSRYNEWEYNREGIDERGLDIEVTFETSLHPLGKERYVANERRFDVNIRADISNWLDKYEAHERNLEIDIIFDIYALVSYSKFLDLMPLIPLKFHDSQTLKDYIHDVGIYIGTWLSRISDMQTLIDPYRVDAEFIQYLANLIGYELIRSNPPVQELRNQLAQAIPWYKIKGSYHSLKAIMQLMNMTVNIYDMYTKDYTTFVRQPWFVADYPGENPPGLTPDYYKSPHFGVEVLLNVVYGSGSDIYLFSVTEKADIVTATEKVRPVNTVPHYSILLNPVTNETGEVIEVDGQVKTKVFLDVWETVFLYFDQDLLGGDPTKIAVYNYHEYNSEKNVYNYSGDYKGWNFDNGHNFDQINYTFLNKIIKWKLGTGNKGVSPGVPGFTLQNPVLSGIVTEKRIVDDKIEFEFMIPASVVQLGLSELGLFFADETTMVLASTFPDIDKLQDVELRVLVQVYNA